MTYSISGILLQVEPGDSKAWQKLLWHYDPFVTDSPAKPDLTVTISPKASCSTDGYELVYHDDTPANVDMRTDMYADAQGNLAFTIQNAGSNEVNGTLYANSAYDTFELHLADERSMRPFAAMAIVTCGVQLAYLLATSSRHRLMSHSSCIVWQDKAYMFIGKSGTGKSTHSSLWLKHIPGSMLLNDDHPIISVAGDKPVAYGSPWSGKTDCYVNDQAPIGAIVRIQQAPHNKITRLSDIQAYASLLPSFSGISFIPAIADARHRDIEALVANVPCYLLECLPDADAARLCNAELRKQVSRPSAFL